MKRLLLFCGLSVMGVWIWCHRAPSTRLRLADLAAGDAVQEPANEPAPMNDVEFAAYGTGGHYYRVSADTAVPSNLRIGFLQTALIPTMELERAVVEQPGPDGAVERIELPHAVMELETKKVRDPSGHVIASTEAW